MTRKPNNMPPAETVHWYGWDEVVRHPSLGPCWEWRGPKHKAGYGNIRTKTPDGRQTFVRAHRIMLAASGVQVPPDLHVLHTCDNPPCIRPGHLRVGTDAENARDRDSRGRLKPVPPQPGELNPQAKLTWSDVGAMREEYAAGGVTQPDLAKKYGVSRSAVGLILQNKRWRQNEAGSA